MSSAPTENPPEPLTVASWVPDVSGGLVRQLRAAGLETAG